MNSLTTMNIRLFSLLAILAVVLTSCSKPDSGSCLPESAVYVTFTNGCDMPITLLALTRYPIVSLKPGESATFSAPYSLLPLQNTLQHSGVRMGYIVFEPIGEVDFISIPTLSMEHLFNEDSYTFKDLGAHRMKYHYTFVESDYEFALSNGKKI